MNVSPEVDALIALLRREIDALRAENAALRADNAELRRRLGLDSSNSSKVSVAGQARYFSSRARRDRAIEVDSVVRGD